MSTCPGSPGSRRPRHRLRWSARRPARGRPTAAAAPGRPAGCPRAARTRRRGGPASRGAGAPRARRANPRSRAAPVSGPRPRARGRRTASTRSARRSRAARPRSARRAPPRAAAICSAARAPRRRRCRASTPSRRATRRAVSSASSSSTAMTSSSRLAVEHRRDEAGADALDLVRPGAPARQHRRGCRLDRDHASFGLRSLRKPPAPVIVPPVPDAGDEAVDPAVERLPDLRAGAAAVRLRVGRVRELVGQPEVVVARERLGGGDRLVHPAQRLVTCTFAP